MITQKSNRIFGLDIIRFVAISLVLLAHLDLPESYYSGIKIGHVGVDIFFVLSGFLIGGILIKDFSSGFNLKQLFSFWKRRWFRTLPLYYLIISFKFILMDNSIGFDVLYYYLSFKITRLVLIFFQFLGVL